MKEPSHLRGKTSIHIVYKRIKDASFPDLWDNIIICYRCWYQRAITLFKLNLVTCASHIYFTITLNAHGDYETIVFL